MTFPTPWLSLSVKGNIATESQEQLFETYLNKINPSVAIKLEIETNVTLYFHDVTINREKNEEPLMEICIPHIISHRFIYIYVYKMLYECFLYYFCIRECSTSNMCFR